MRFIRLVCRNNTPKRIGINRFFMFGGGVGRSGGAFVHRWGGEFYGPPNVKQTGTSGGYWVGGQRIIRERQSGIPNAAAGTEVATINTILDRLRSHGLIWG